MPCHVIACMSFRRPAQPQGTRTVLQLPLLHCHSASSLRCNSPSSLNGCDVHVHLSLPAAVRPYPEQPLQQQRVGRVPQRRLGCAAASQQSL